MSPSSGKTSGLSVTACSSRSIAPLDVGERIGHRAEHLRRAAQRVRVLHAAAVGVAGDDRAAREQRGELWATVAGPGCAAQAVQARVERHGRALERLQAERDGDDGGLEQPARVAHRQRPGRGHQVRAVDQCEAFLGGQRDRLQAGARQRLAARERLAAERRLALADQHQREVGERREVPGRADRSLARHDRRDAALEQLAAASSTSSTRTPECPRRSEDASSNSIPRTTSSGSGGPEPTACERSRLTCSCAASAGAIRTLSSWPNPVVTP